MFFLAAFSCSAYPGYTLRPVVGTVSLAHVGRTFQASAALRFVIVPAPRTPRTHDRALDDHLRGYIVVAQRVAQSSVGRTTAAGATASQARERLHHAIAQMTADAQKELLREERFYDAVTEDGTAQDQGPQYGVPGGADLRAPAPCARPA